MITKLVDANNLRDIVAEIGASKHLEVWVWDGRGANARRRSIWPEYKRQRGALPHTPAWQVAAPGWEADDVIAHLVPRLPAPVVVVSTDFDFHQLHDPPRVYGGCTTKPGVLPHEVRLYKTLVGDPRDNIPGIPGFGPKTWEKCDREVLLNLIRGDSFVVDSGRLPPRVWIWLSNPANRRLLRAMWEVVGFFPVPDDAIRIERGTPNPGVVEHVLRELFI